MIGGLHPPRIPPQKLLGGCIPPIPPGIYAPGRETNGPSRRATRQTTDCNNLNIPRNRTNTLLRWIKYDGVNIGIAFP